MKICPRCRTRFEDDLNYCLSDGSTLKDYGSYNPEDTISATDNATLEYQSPPTANQNKLTNQTNYGQSPQYVPRSNSFMIFGGIFGLVFLLFGTIIGFGLYFYYQTEPFTTQYPTPYQDFPPTHTPAPESKNNIKVEILEKVKNNDGREFLKCKITNVGVTIVRPFNLSLLFYKGDVIIKESGDFVKLEYLKSGQSVPVWISLYGTDNYTSVKVKEPISTFPVYKTEEQLFPNLIFTETEIKPENSYYKVSGIIENQNYENISTELYIIFYDEKSEIISIEKTPVNGLKKGDKKKFEVQTSSMYLFGKPTAFEIIAISE